MKVNHRDGTIKRNENERMRVPGLLKRVSVRAMRVRENQGIRELLADPDSDVVLPDRNWQVCDRWRFD